MLGDDRTAEEPEIKCSSQASCKITYDNRYTPELIDIVPSQVYYGETVAWMLNAKACHSRNALPTTWEPFYYLKIGKENSDWEGLIDSGTRLPDW